jgi:hypothetical protein
MILLIEITWSTSTGLRSRIVLRKAGLAMMKITFYSVQIIHGEIEWLLTPKLMKSIS